MSKQVIGGAFAAGGMKLPFAKAVRAGDLVFVSGQMATDASGQLIAGNIEAQARQVFRNIEAILAEARCTMADVVKCTCWIDDPRDFTRFNAVFAEVFPDQPPARSTVISRLVLDGKLEVEAIAYNPPSQAPGAQVRPWSAGTSADGPLSRSQASSATSAKPSTKNSSGDQLRVVSGQPNRRQLASSAAIRNAMIPMNDNMIEPHMP
jgi:2-iminobutanoate/2-iminopropanoate deaminase